MLDIPRLARFLRTEQPDILLSNLDLNNVAALLAKGLSFSRTKVVICQHNPISSSFVASENWLYRCVPLFYRMLSPLISRAVAVSGGVAEELAALARLPRDRILTINNPVVGPDFQERSQEIVDHPWFHEPRKPVFITAGRLVSHKDHETMIRALSIHRKRFDSRLIVLGTGPLQQALADLVVQLGLTTSVDFLGFRCNVLPFFRQADAFLLSSRCEGFGNVIVEALGCGTPVISVRCQHGPAEILDNGRYGVLVNSRDPKALADAMDQVATLRERFPAEGTTPTRNGIQLCGLRVPLHGHVQGIGTRTGVDGVRMGARRRSGFNSTTTLSSQNTRGAALNMTADRPASPSRPPYLSVKLDDPCSTPWRPPTPSRRE